MKKVNLKITVDVDIKAYMEEYDIETEKEAIEQLRADAKADIEQWLESRGFSKPQI